MPLQRNKSILQARADKEKQGGLFETRLMIIRIAFVICAANVFGNATVYLTESAAENVEDWDADVLEDCEFLWAYQKIWMSIIGVVSCFFLPFMTPVRFMPRKFIKERYPVVVLNFPPLIIVSIFCVILACALLGCTAAASSASEICREVSPNTYNAGTLNICVGTTVSIGFIISFLTCVHME